MGCHWQTGAETLQRRFSEHAAHCTLDDNDYAALLHCACMRGSECCVVQLAHEVPVTAGQATTQTLENSTAVLSLDSPLRSARSTETEFETLCIPCDMRQCGGITDGHGPLLQAPGRCRWAHVHEKQSDTDRLAKPPCWPLCQHARADALLCHTQQQISERVACRFAARQSAAPVSTPPLSAAPCAAGSSETLTQVC